MTDSPSPIAGVRGGVAGARRRSCGPTTSREGPTTSRHSHRTRRRSGPTPRSGSEPCFDVSCCLLPGEVRHEAGLVVSVENGCGRRVTSRPAHRRGHARSGSRRTAGPRRRALRAEGVRCRCDRGRRPAPWSPRTTRRDRVDADGDEIADRHWSRPIELPASVPSASRTASVTVNSRSCVAVGSGRQTRERGGVGDDDRPVTGGGRRQPERLRATGGRGRRSVRRTRRFVGGRHRRDRALAT